MKSSQKTIRTTFWCNVYPFLINFYEVKLGYAGVLLIFLFLLQNIDCGYSLHQAGSNNLRYEHKKKKKKKEKYKKITNEIFNFYKLRKNLYITCFCNDMTDGDLPVPPLILYAVSQPLV